VGFDRVVEFMNEEFAGAPLFGRRPRIIVVPREHLILYDQAACPPDVVELMGVPATQAVVRNLGLEPYFFMSMDDWKLAHGYGTDRPPRPKPLYVNIGSGPDFLPRPWLNIDVFINPNLAEGFDTEEYDVRPGLRFRDGEVDAIYSSHFLEHLTIYEGFAVLSECYRVLRPGGRIRLVLPKTGEIIQRYLSDRMDDYRFIVPELDTVSSQGLKFVMLFFGGGDSSRNFDTYTGHRSCYDPASAREILERTGFKDVCFPELMESEVPELRGLDGHHLNVSFAVEAKKEGP